MWWLKRSKFADENLRYGKALLLGFSKFVAIIAGVFVLLMIPGLQMVGLPVAFLLGFTFPFAALVFGIMALLILVDRGDHQDLWGNLGMTFGWCLFSLWWGANCNV